MRNRSSVVGLIIALTTVATVPATAGTVVTIDPVKTTVRNEQLPAASITMAHTYFAWTQNAAGGFDHAFLETDGGPKAQIDTGDYGWVGGFADADPRLIYQRAVEAGRTIDSNLVFFDAATGTTTPAPGRINSAVWQWSPSYDTDGSDQLWILYGENRFVSPTSLWQIKIWDEASGMRRTLAKGPRRCRCVLPGSIAFPFASWTNGAPGDAFVFDLGSDARTRLSLSPAGPR